MRKTVFWVTLGLVALPASALAGELYPNISSYHGKYINEPVDDYLLFENERTRNAIETAAPDAETAALIFSQNAVSGPIDGDENVLRGLYQACEPHNCGAHQWGFVFDEISGNAAVCHFVMESGQPALWYGAGGLLAEQEGGCPYRLADVPQAVGDAVYHRWSFESE